MRKGSSNKKKSGVVNMNVLIEHMPNVFYNMNEMS